MDLDRIQTGVNQYIVSNNALWDGLSTRANPVIDNGSVTARPTIAWYRGSFQRCTLTANTTFAFAGPIDGLMYTLLINTGAGAFTGAWPSTVKWIGAAAPTVTVTANRYDIMTFRFVKALNTYFGSFQQNYN